MGQQRETMVSAFARQGYRTIAVMPGLQHAWPQGGFYGFDETYGTSRLGYQGPPFGWWDITDQYTVARLDALAIAPQPRAPVFVFFPTISTHTPFVPTPPYQPDWTRALTTTPYDQEELDRAWSQWADWFNLGPAYTQSLEYVHAWLGGYMRLRHDRDFVMMLVGDHQPPAMVAGEDASWNVPVHIVTSRRSVLDGLVNRGFRQGLAPQYPTLGKMNELLPILLDSFSSTRPRP
jgi:phosphoglycerol transferase MdoB-like AlkP superfamily enzyme